MIRTLAPLDWGIVVAYLGLALLVGAAVSRKAGRSLDSYFVAERGLPWWWLGTSMVATTFAADTPLVLYPLFPDARDEYLLVGIVAIAMSAALAATFLTPPVPREHLARFVQRVRPPGFWAGLPGAAPRSAMLWTAAAWIAGNIAVFGLTFGIGRALLGGPLAGAALALLGAAALPATMAAARRARRHVDVGTEEA